MSALNITPEQILEAVQQVPVERWGEVLQAIEGLQDEPQPSGADAPILTGVDLKNSELIGIWADRADLGANHDFARRLRHEAEQRR